MAKNSEDKAIKKINMIEVTPQKKTAQQIKNNLNKKYGNAKLASETDVIQRVPSGILELDYMLGGGFPKGRVCLLSGTESSFKSTICLKTIAEAQKAGGTCGWVDAEASFDAKWASENGVNLDELILVQPNDAEQAYDIMTTMFNDGLDVVVLDSLNTLSAKKEMYADEKGLEAESINRNAMGVNQKLTSQFLRTALGRIGRSKTLFLVITQMRDSLSANKYMPSTTLVGGKSVIYCSSLILMMRAIQGAAGKLMDGSDKQVGQVYESKLSKTRFGRIGQVCQFNAYGTNVDNYSAILKIGQELKFIERVGTKTYHCNGRTFNGKNALVQALYDEQGLFDYCMNEIKKSYDGPAFSFDPYSKEDVAAKEKAIAEAKEFVPTDDDGVEIPEEDLEETIEE